MAPDPIESRLRVPSHHLLLDLIGESDRHLRQVEDLIPEVRFVARGDEIVMTGESADVERARTVLNELLYGWLYEIKAEFGAETEAEFLALARSLQR